MTSEPQQPDPQPIASGKPAPILIIFLIIPLLGILVALLMVASELNQASSTDGLIAAISNPATLINSGAPDFTLPLLDRDIVSLEDYRGRILFLNFWQTTCVPCITELPEFIDFMSEQNPDEVALLTVNFEESAETIRAFLARHNIVGLPIALDLQSTVRREYGIQGIPVTFVIDAQGTVRYTNIGMLTLDDMQAYLERVQSTTLNG
jgi:peroxiredoxin